jgi:hypothetical protein
MDFSTYRANEGQENEKPISYMDAIRDLIQNEYVPTAIQKELLAILQKLENMKNGVELSRIVYTSMSPILEKFKPAYTSSQAAMQALRNVLK